MKVWDFVTNVKTYAECFLGSVWNVKKICNKLRRYTLWEFAKSQSTRKGGSIWKHMLSAHTIREMLKVTFGFLRTLSQAEKSNG